MGLPVYNGANYIAESIDALLGQSFSDFELIISDNASTDETGDICRRYEKQDSRVRYFRQPQNIGLAPNHNFVAVQARGELFKWASNDDLYARDLLERCIDALDKYPDVVLAHSWTAKVDGSGAVTQAFKYPLTTDSPRASERFRSVLFDSGGDDDYGVMRLEVLRRTAMKESYHHADHTIIAEIVLHGRFYQVPDWLYFRRDHADRAERACPTMRSRCVNMDPRRADRLRHPTARLYGEYIWGYIRAIRHAPLASAERRECYRYLAEWLASRARPGGAPESEPTPVPHPDISVDSVVAGRERKPFMNDSANAGGAASEGAVKSYKRDFWIKENQKHVPAHYRLQKAARVVSDIARGRECDLLDVGCGPATFGSILPRNIHYHGIDLAIHDPAPNLIETDILENPIKFGNKQFDIIVALGVFEYVGSFQSQKFGEIAQLLNERGKFVVSYTNFDHHDKHIFEAFSNVQSFGDFRQSLARHFTIARSFPASHNWHGGQPTTESSQSS